jgi:hypothetical protein
VVDAVVGELGQRRVQADGVGRGERAVAVEPPGRHAESPERGRLMAEHVPDLAGELDGRGLAVGAGHRRDDGGLASEEGRGQQRQAPAGVRVGDQRGLGSLGQGRPRRRQDGRGARRERLGNEAPSVGLRSWKRREERSRAHGPGVDRKARDLGIAGLGARVGFGLAGE